MKKTKNFFIKTPLLFIAVIFLIFNLAYAYSIYNSIKIKPKQKPAKIVTQKPIIRKISNLEILKNGPRNLKNIALTFDADMTYSMLSRLQKGQVKSWYNKDIKDTLDKENTKATVFLTGLWVKAYTNETKELAKDPLIELGNHTFSHLAFTQNCYKLQVADENTYKEEIEKAQKIIKETTGVSPKFFRFPGGCYGNSDIKLVNGLGLITTDWDVVSGDSFNENTNAIIANVEANVQNGSIVVFHINGGPNAPKTNEALKQIIPNLKKRGFNFVKLSDLLTETNYAMGNK